jgi:hypothetical protein
LPLLGQLAGLPNIDGPAASFHKTPNAQICSIRHEYCIYSSSLRSAERLLWGFRKLIYNKMALPGKIAMKFSLRIFYHCFIFVIGSAPAKINMITSED